jgi:hypothetical protein
VYGFVYDMPVRDICVFQEAILDGGISRLPDVAGMAFDVYLTSPRKGYKQAVLGDYSPKKDYKPAVLGEL